MLAVVLMASMAFPVSAQQPAPAPPPVATRETPEAEASRDLEQMGEAATREKANKWLDDAVRGMDEPRTEGRTCRSDDPEIQDLRDAVRYYARAHGLSKDIDALIEEMEALGDLARSKQFALPPEEAVKALKKRWGARFGLMMEALGILKAVKACETAAPAPPRTVGVADPPGGKLRVPKLAWIGLGGGGLAAAALILVGGGSDSPPSAAPPPAPLTPFNPAGIYDVAMTVRTDPGGNAPRIGMEPSLPLNFIVTGSSLRFTCPPGVHINPGEGPVDLTTGAFNIAGSGPFAGRNGVQFLFPGTFNRDGTVTGEYRVGTAGELGQVTTYGVNGRRRQ